MIEYGCFAAIKTIVQVKEWCLKEWQKMQKELQTIHCWSLKKGRIANWARPHPKIIVHSTRAYQIMLEDASSRRRSCGEWERQPWWTLLKMIVWIEKIEWLKGERRSCYSGIHQSESLTWSSLPTKVQNF